MTAASAALRLGQIARLTVVLGPGDVPTRPEHVRLAARAAAAAGGWAHLRGLLDSLDFTTPDARRALRAAVGATQPKALLSRRGWNALRTRFPRLPSAEEIGLGDGQRRREGAAEDGAKPRRRRRRRLHAPAAEAEQRGAPASAEAASPNGAGPGEPPAEGAGTPAQPPPPPAPPPPVAQRHLRGSHRRPRGRAAAADRGLIPHAIARSGRRCAYAWDMTEPLGSEAVADALWDRVRRLARTVDGLVEADALGELDVDGKARLDRARVRLRRAVERAQMADDLADQMAELRSRARRRGRAGRRLADQLGRVHDANRRRDLAQACGDLDRAARIGDGDRAGAGAADRLGLLAPQLRRELGLEQRVQAGRTAAATAPGDLDRRTADRRDGPPQVRPERLAVDVVAGVVAGDRAEIAAPGRQLASRAGRAPARRRLRPARPRPGRRRAGDPRTSCGCCSRPS